MPGYYTITTSPFASDPLTTTQIGNVQTLFDMAFGSLTLTSNAQSAGFQLALWEIIYETTGTLSVGNGNFTASGNTGAVNFANTLLGNLVSAGPVTQVYNLTFLESQNGQDLVTASPVPLPAAGLLLLAALGIYGVLSYSVSERTKEIGLRLALGSTVSETVGLIVRQSITLVAVGGAVGLLGSLLLARSLAGVLYGIGPFDVPAFVMATAGLLVAGVGASLVPALRTTRVDPMICLL